MNRCTADHTSRRIHDQTFGKPGGPVLQNEPASGLDAAHKRSAIGAGETAQRNFRNAGDGLAIGQDEGVLRATGKTVVMIGMRPRQTPPSAMATRMLRNTAA